MTYAVSPAHPHPPADPTATTRAVLRDSWGEPSEVLRVEAVERPTPGAGEVLVAVHAAGVERGSWHLVTGLPKVMRLVFGVRRPKRQTLGIEVAGVVESLGEGVSGFTVGQPVFGNASYDGFAEHATVRADKLAPRPAGLTAVQAAACPISGSTALQAVRDHAAVRSGQHVLVIGAAGGIGTFAVQIARALGAVVTAVARTEHLDLVRSLGAHQVIDHTTQQIDAHGVSYDAIIDTGGHRTLRELRRSLAPKGRLVLVGSEPGGALLGGTDRQLRALALSPFVGQGLGTFVSSEDAAHLVALTALLEAGSVVPQIDRTFPLAEAAAAIDHLTTGHPGGKVVLEVAGA